MAMTQIISHFLMEDEASLCLGNCALCQPCSLVSVSPLSFPWAIGGHEDTALTGVSQLPLYNPLL